MATLHENKTTSLIREEVVLTVSSQELTILYVCTDKRLSNMAKETKSLVELLEYHKQ